MDKPHSLSIRGYSGQTVPNEFFPAGEPANHLAIIFPGRGYTALMPVLYYPTLVLNELGADILRVDYQFNSEDFMRLPEKERDQRFYHEVSAAFQAGIAQGKYNRLTLVGKSLGTLAIGHLLETATLPEKVDCLWLTPLIGLEHLRKQIAGKRHRALFVIGTKDPHFNMAHLAEVEKATAGRCAVIEGADHSLEIPGKVSDSVRAQTRIIEAVERFFV
ncbi:MAG: hypothetical protein M1369_03480 [Deinococcus sp.]|nr:hypothetical protein [Deinococcus sp.]